MNRKVSDKEIRELIKKYKKEKDISIRNDLIEKHTKLIWYIVHRIRKDLKRIPIELEDGDLFGYGVFGIIDAFDKFDIRRKTSFKTFAYKRIYGEIIDQIRKISFFPSAEIKKQKEYVIKIPVDDLVDNEAITTEDLHSDLERKILAEEIDSALDKLTEKEKEAVIWKILDGKKQSDLAKKLNKSESCISLRVKNAKKKLKILLDKQKS